MFNYTVRNPLTYQGVGQLSKEQCHHLVLPGVTACLQRDHPLSMGFPTQTALRMAVLSGPTVVTMSANCIIKDEVTVVTYMDTMTTSVGRVTLSGPRQEASTQGPTILDIMDLV